MTYFNSFLFLLSSLSIFVEKNGVVEGIVGGSYAHIGQLKYQVSVQADDSHVCGGAILSRAVVITAAHCVIDDKRLFRKENFTIIAGVIDLYNENRNRIQRRVDNITVPSFYKHPHMANSNNAKNSGIGDIALLWLADTLDVENSPFVGTVYLPRVRKGAFLNEDLTVSGFGTEQPNSEGSLYGRANKAICNEKCRKLKYADAASVHKNICKPRFKDIIQEEHICIRIKQQNENIPEGLCEGDSGSPVVSDTNELVGILSSFKQFCHTDWYPAVYSRIIPYLTFIREVLAKEIPRTARFATYKTVEPNAVNPVPHVELVEVFRFL